MDPQFEAQAKLFAGDGEVRQVQSVDEMVDALQTVPFKITTLFILAHTLANGDMLFPSDGFITPMELSSKLQGTIPAGHQPATLDFRGCSIGLDPKSMNSLRTAVGAGSVVGTNCFMNLFRGPSVTVKGKVITRRSQLKTNTEKAVFRREFRTLPGRFGDMAACIVDHTENGYFAAGGHLVVAFTTKTLHEGYDPTRATCLTDLTTTTLTPQQAEAGGASGSQHCKLVRIDAASPLPPAGSPTMPEATPAPTPSPTVPPVEETE